MRMTAAVAASVVLFVHGAAAAQTRAAAPSAADAAAEANIAAQCNASACILVFRVEAKNGVAQDEADTVAGLVATALQAVTKGAVETMLDVRRRLETGAERDRLRTCDEFRCLAEIGNALGAPFFVAGDLGRLGEVWTLNLQLSELQNLRVLNRLSLRIEGPLGALARGVTSEALAPLVADHVPMRGAAGTALPPPGREARPSSPADESYAKRFDGFHFFGRLYGGLDMARPTGVAGSIGLGVALSRWFDLGVAFAPIANVFLIDADVNFVRVSRFVPFAGARFGIDVDAKGSAWLVEGYAGAKVWIFDWLAIHGRLGVGWSAASRGGRSAGAVIAPAWTGVEFRY